MSKRRIMLTLAILLLSGANKSKAQATGQTTIIINWTRTTADTFNMVNAPSLLVINLGRETTGVRAHLICGYSTVIKGAQPWPFALRWAGDTVRRFLGTQRPICVK